METKVEALEDNKVKLTITVGADEIDARIKKAYKDFANRYNFPGFRRGKAPRPVIDSALGAEAVPAAVTEEVINESYPLAVDESLIFPVGRPEFDDKYLMVKGGEPFTFTATVAVKPTLELSSYEPVSIELPAEKATEAEIAQQIDQLRDYYYTYEDANANTKIAEGGYADLKVSATDAAGEVLEPLCSESRLYGLGTGMFPAAFDAELVGMKKGQSKEFDVNLADGNSTMTSSYIGKTESIHFTVEVNVVKKRVLPELTDEWVKETFGFEGVDGLREQVVESIERQKAEVLPALKENRCLMALAERLEGEVPTSMVEENETELLRNFFQQLQQQGMSLDVYLMQNNLTADQFKEDVKHQASDMAKQNLALDAWARNKGLVASDDDITAEFERSGAEDPKALQEQWRKNGQLFMVREGILRSRAMNDIMDTAVVTEEKPAEVEEKPAKKKSAAKKSSSKKAAKKDDEAKAEDAAPADSAEGETASEAPADAE